MDHHFLVRYSFTGVIFLLCALGGLWVVNDAAARTVIEQCSGSNMQVGSAVISAVATVPIIGVLIHGLYLIISYLKWGHSFPDAARKEVASAIRTKALNSAALSTAWKDHFKPKPSNPRPLPDDSLFVWLYYFDAPQHLIEWARRRRDYFYLGISWAMAVGLGLIFGMIAGGLVFYHSGISADFASGPKLGYAALLVFCCAVFIVASIWLGLQMKYDVDAMELVWAAARLNGDLHQELPPKSFDGVNISLSEPGVANGLSSGLANLTGAVGGGLTGIGNALTANLQNFNGPSKNSLDSQLQSYLDSRLSELQTSFEDPLREISSKIESLRAPAGDGQSPPAPQELEGGNGKPTEPGQAV